MLSTEERYILLDRIDRLEKALKQEILDHQEDVHELEMELGLCEYYHELRQRKVKDHLKEVSANDLMFYTD